MTLVSHKSRILLASLILIWMLIPPALSASLRGAAPDWETSALKNLPSEAYCPSEPFSRKTPSAAPSFPWEGVGKVVFYATAAMGGVMAQSAYEKNGGVMPLISVPLLAYTAYVGSEVGYVPKTFTMLGDGFEALIAPLAGAGAAYGLELVWTGLSSAVEPLGLLVVGVATADLMIRHVKEVNRQRYDSAESSADKAFLAHRVILAAGAPVILSLYPDIKAALQLLSSMWSILGYAAPSMGEFLILDTEELQPIIDAAKTSDTFNAQWASLDLNRKWDRAFMVKPYTMIEPDLKNTRAYAMWKKYGVKALEVLVQKLQEKVSMSLLTFLMYPETTIHYVCDLKKAPTLRVGYSRNFWNNRATTLLYRETLQNFYQAYGFSDIPFFIKVQLPLAAFALTTAVWYVTVGAMSLI